MEKQLAIAVIHGMGSQTREEFEEKVADLSEDINRRVEDLGADPRLIAWQPVYWAAELEGRQRSYLEDARKENDLDYRKLRKFVVGALGDAAAYLPVRSRQASNKTYDAVHRIVRDSIQKLHGKVGQDDRPLIVVAHSLGSVIISNYIWDLQQGMAMAGGSDFEAMQTLVGLITFGSTLPLFTFAYDPVQPIEFPPPGLSPDLEPKARWYNFFDADDVLGYPLQQISPEYARLARLEDREIELHGMLTSWNPLAHQGYWTDDGFTRPVAEFVAGLLEA